MAIIHNSPTSIFNAETIQAVEGSGPSAGRWLTLKADDVQFGVIFYSKENTAYLDALAYAINSVPKRMSQALLRKLAADPANAEADRDSHDEAKAWHSRPVPVSFDGGPF